MMKKEYQTPEIEFTKFGTEDCITASTDTIDFGDPSINN